MEFKISDYSDKGVIRQIKIYHGNEKLTFRNDLSRSLLTSPSEVLKSLNDFVSHFSKEQCDSIFEIYQELSELSDYSNGCLTPVGWLDVRTRVERLFKIVNPESVFMWGKDYGRFHNPQLPEVNNYAAETTYTPAEYRELLSLTVLLKFMMPIWGEFYTHIRQSTPKEEVERQCWRLLETTGIFELPAYKRLEKYVTHQKGIVEILVNRSQPLPMAMVMAGKGESDLLPLIISTIIIKNMTFSETTIQMVKGKDNNLIGVIHQVILRRLESLEKGFGGRVGVINHPSENPRGGEEGNTSISENFAAKTEVSDVEPRLYNYYCQNVEMLANSMYPKGQLDMDLVKTFVDFTHHLSDSNNFYFGPGRHYLVSVMLFGIIPDLGVDYLNRTSVLNVVGVSCAIIHTIASQNESKDSQSIGMFDLVKYFLAKPTGIPDVEIYGRAQQARSSYVPDDIVEELSKYYPHTYQDVPAVKGVIDWITEFIKNEICSTFWIEQTPNLGKDFEGIYKNKEEWFADKEMKSLICLLMIMVFQRKEQQLATTKL